MTVITICPFSPDAITLQTCYFRGEEMTMTIKNYVTIADHKHVPKQVPLFEEQDDGKLIPYVKET